MTTLTDTHNKMAKNAEKTKIFTGMQQAVDHSQDSVHPTNPIGASLELADGTYISSSNMHVKELGAVTDKIGGASPTVHAEIAVLLKAIAEGKSTLGAKIFITDPPCPSCTKVLIEAGISEIYVDKKGFEKEWYKKNKQDLKEMSYPLAGQAGIPIYRTSRDKDHATAKVKLLNKNMLAEECNLPYEKIEFRRLLDGHTANVKSLVNQTKQKFDQEARFSAMIARSIAPKSAGAPIFIALHQSDAVTLHKDGNQLDYESEKYSFETLAVDRLIASCARHGVMPLSPIILSDYQEPSEIIDLAGLAKITRGGEMLAIDILDMTYNQTMYQMIHKLKEAGLLETRACTDALVFDPEKKANEEAFLCDMS